MIGSFRSSSPTSKKKSEREWLGVSFKPENFVPGLVIGFILGLLLDFSKPAKSSGGRKIGSFPLGKNQQQQRNIVCGTDEELKMVLVVRQDLKMGSGKTASQCAHAATGMYAELMQSNRSLLRQWEQCGQAKIVVTCKNQQEMNKLKDAAESVGLPTFTVTDAGRTQSAVKSFILSFVLRHCDWAIERIYPSQCKVSTGSRTVLAIGPGNKSAVDSVTGKLRLL